MTAVEVWNKVKMWVAGGAVASAGILGGYEFHEVQNTQEELGDPTKFRYSPSDEVRGIFVHHVAGDMTPEEIDKFHQSKFNSGGIAYTYYFEKSGQVHYTSRWELRKAQASKMNTVSRGFCFNGNFETEVPTQESLNQYEIQLFAALRTFPHIEWVRPHSENIYSNTACPGVNLDRALRDRGLFFESREEINVWLKKMEMRLLNPCMDARLDDLFIDGEPC